MEHDHDTTQMSGISGAHEFFRAFGPFLETRKSGGERVNPAEASTQVHTLGRRRGAVEPQQTKAQRRYSGFSN
jgi:hypothetical protein